MIPLRALSLCLLLAACAAPGARRAASVQQAEWLEARARWVEAGEIWSRLLDADRADAAAARGLARTLAAEGDARGALAVLDAGSRAAPGDARLRYEHGLALVGAGRAAEALSELAAACDAEPDWSAPWRERGLLAAQLGRPAEARAAWERVCALRPEDGNAAARLAWARAGDGARVEALAAWERAFAHGAFDVASALEAGRLALAEPAWWERAGEWVERARALDPQSAAAQRLGGELALALGRGDDAVFALRRALELDPGDLDVLERLAALHLARGDREEHAALAAHARLLGAEDVAERLERAAR